MASDDMDISARVNAAVTRELARLTAELQESAYENIGQGGSRGHSVDWFDAADSASTMSYSDWAFGFSISGAVVTVNSGEIHHGTRAVVTCAGGDKEITDDLQYLWVEYTFGSTATLMGPSTTRPVSTETVMKVWIALFNFADSVATLNQIGHLGNIEIPGAFG